MRDILDSAGLSLGTPLTVQLFAPIPRPVAVNDAVTVLQDSGPVTIAAPGQTLSINATGDNTLEVTADPGLIETIVTDPPELQGSYSFDTALLAGGPVNLVAPDVTGPFATGQTVSAVPGLWAIDTGAGVHAITYQWFRDATPIAGATAASHVLDAADLGGVRVTETLSDAFGSRSAQSGLYTGVAAFTPAADTGLQG